MARFGRPLALFLLRFFTENLFLKALSIILAVTIWAWVQSQQVVEKRARATVVYKWPDGLIRTQEVPKTLVLTVSGPQGLVRLLPGSDLHVPVDLSDERPGASSVDFTQQPITGLPAGVSVTQWSPPTIAISLDKKMTRTVFVSPVVVGEPAEGWALLDGDRSFRIEPKLVEISGPQSLVRTITEVHTDPVDIGGIDRDVRRSVGLAIKERTITSGLDGPIDVHVSVKAITTERTFNEAPVRFFEDGWETDIKTATIKVEGPLNAVSEIKPTGVFVMLHPPPPSPEEEEAVELRWDPQAPQPQIEVILKGAPDTVRVVSVEPARITPTPVIKDEQ